MGWTPASETKINTISRRIMMMHRATTVAMLMEAWPMTPLTIMRDIQSTSNNRIMVRHRWGRQNKGHNTAQMTVKMRKTKMIMMMTMARQRKDQVQKSVDYEGTRKVVSQVASLVLRVAVMALFSMLEERRKVVRSDQGSVINLCVTVMMTIKSYLKLIWSMCLI